MSSREIGKITSVGIHGVIADVNSDLGNYINTVDGILFVGEVGSYVSIYEIGRTIIAEIVGVDEKTQTTNSGELDDRVLKLAANSSEVFNVNILSLNSVDVNKYNSYSLLYFVRFKCLVWLEWININGYV